MTEVCVCGAQFNTSKYKHLKKWRKEHKSNHPKEIADKEGTTSDTQIAPQWQYNEETFYEAKHIIGFIPNKGTT